MLSGGDSENDSLPTEKTPLLTGPVKVNHSGLKASNTDDSAAHDAVYAEKEGNLRDTLSGNGPFVPSRTRKAIVVLSCWLLQMISNGLGFGMGVMYVELVRVFQGPHTVTALVQAIYMAVMVGGGFIFTPCVMKYGPGPCLMVASVIASLGFIGSSYAVNLPMLIVLTGVVAGLGMSVAFLCTFITISWIFHSQPGALLVFVTTGSSIGQFLFPYLNEILITAFDWRRTFFIMGAVALQCVPIGLVIFTSRKFYKTGSDVSEHDGGSSILQGLFDVSLFKDPLVMFFLFNGLILDFTGMFESWFIVDIMVTRGYGRAVGTSLLQVMGIANFIGRLSAVILKLVFKVPTVTHWIYICLLIGASHAMIAFFHTYWPLFAASLLYGYSFGVICAQIPAIMFEVTGLERYPQAIALLDLTFGIADLLCGLVGGLINDVTGRYRLFLYIAVGVSLYVAFASVLMSYFVQRSHRTAGTSDQEETAPLTSSKLLDKRLDKKYLRLTNRRGTVF